MRIFHYACHGGRRFRKRTPRRGGHGARLAALFLCLCILASFLPALAAADESKKLSDIARIQNITLHYAEEDGTPGDVVQDNALLEANMDLVLRYAYEITEEQCKEITAGTPYYLEISPHLELPDLKNGSALTIESESGTEQFGMIYADGRKAWVTFDAGKDGSGTVLSELGGIENAYFYLDCGRADAPPAGEPPLEGHNNLYAMKFETGEQIYFGYAENEPITAKAQINKDGDLKDKTITWSIDYTPWQNPAEDDGVAMDTPFELRDTIDTTLHDYIDGSAKVNGDSVPVYSSRDTIPADAETYLITVENGTGTDLIFGGTKFNAVEATKGNPAEALKITYQTSIKDELLLPGKGSGKEITNAVELFAGENGIFHDMKISGRKTVAVPQPLWMKKEGQTTRYTDGTGSTTDWTITFYPNGFTFAETDNLTLHDQLPQGSTLVKDSVYVGDTEVSAVPDTQNGFTVSPIQADGKSVTITYQTHVPEEMYDSGTSLGSNTAWFTFQQKGEKYTTPSVNTPVGSGDGSGKPGTSTLVKTNNGYNPANRTIEWTVNINPHKAYLRSGTFIDDLSAVGGVCTVSGHKSGLELADGIDGVSVLIDGRQLTEDEKKMLDLTYDNQKITIQAGQIGAKTITLNYTTKVCDPCIFANNTAKTPFKNIISTENMVIGRNSNTESSVSADSTADVSAAVLSKKPPVYDYVNGVMKWEVEVDAAGLPMEDVVLTDSLPDGLSFMDGSFRTIPEIKGATAQASGQELEITLGTVTEKTSIFFDTKAAPELLGFGGGEPVIVENSIRMQGSADGVIFAEVSHSVQQNFANHGLVKRSAVDNKQELIQYEVLVNPFGLALPGNPSLVDTLDKRLQLDMDTLRFYKAELSGTTADKDQKPGYMKTGEGQPLKVAGFDPAENSFSVVLPIEAGSRDAYVLAYTADMLQKQPGGYGNSVRFDGGDVLLGGSKQNSATVGGGGGGGGGIAARKASIAVAKKDSETGNPLAGVTFTLYQWDAEKNARGIPFAQGETDGQGMLAFRVSPGAAYELAETGSLPGYGSELGWTELPEGAKATDDGIFITAGAAKSELKLELTNNAHTADIVFRLLNESGIPAAGTKVQLFKANPVGESNPVPDAETVVFADGTVRFRGVRRGAEYFVKLPDARIMTVKIPADTGQDTTVQLPDGTEAVLTADFHAAVAVPPEETWTLTVLKTTSDGTAPLQGAVIGLYTEEDCRTLAKSGISNAEGKIVFEGLMKGQNYWLKEISAPEGYHLDSTVFAADEGLPLVTIANQPRTPDAKPDEPGKPGTPDISGRPGKPGRPGAADGFELPGEPEAPDIPETIDGLEAPEEGEMSDTLEASGSMEISDSANDSVSLGNHGIIEEDDLGFLEAADIPQTGDSTPWLAATALLSGILLAGMTACHLARVNRHEKK